MLAAGKDARVELPVGLDFIPRKSYNKYMKSFKLEIKNASPVQLATIALDLKVMSNGWSRFGPKIIINDKKVEPPALRIPGSARLRKKK